jgi:hypothetical protein
MLRFFFFFVLIFYNILPQLMYTKLPSRSRFFELPPQTLETRKLLILRSSRYIEKLVIYNAASYEDKSSRDRQILFELVAECCLVKALKNLPSFSIPGEDVSLNFLKHYYLSLGVDCSQHTASTPNFILKRQY